MLKTLKSPRACERNSVTKKIDAVKQAKQYYRDILRFAKRKSWFITRKTSYTKRDRN
jgi:hypothetical protein